MLEELDKARRALIGSGGAPQARDVLLEVIGTWPEKERHDLIGMILLDERVRQVEKRRALEPGEALDDALIEAGRAVGRSAQETVMALAKPLMGVAPPEPPRPEPKSVADLLDREAERLGVGPIPWGRVSRRRERELDLPAGCERAIERAEWDNAKGERVSIFVVVDERRFPCPPIPAPPRKRARRSS